MKKLLFLFVFISNFSFAQDWSLFPVNDTLCYQAASSNYISNTIIVKSFINNNSKFSFSKSIYLCDTCPKSNNSSIFSLQSDFLYNYFSIDSNQRIVLFNENEDTSVLFINKPINFTWNYQPNITATVYSILSDSIFNTLDSIKTILFSNGDSLKISKNFGVYLFKHSTLGYLKLIGNHSKKLGLNLIDISKEEKVGVNDYLNFEYYRFQGDYGFPCSYNESTLFRVKSIEKTAWNTIFHGISYNSHSGYALCSPPMYSSGSYLNLYDDLYLDSLIYNPLPNSLLNYGFLSPYFDTLEYNILTYDKIGNSIRINAIPNYDSISLRKFTLNKIGPNRYEQNRIDFFDARIETAFPYFSYEYSDFEYAEYKVLSGYTIKGQKFGTIDTNLILGINTLKTFTTSIFPQPNNGEFTIALNDAVITGNINVSVLDLNGRTVFAKEYDKNNMLKVETTTLQNGVYILKINIGEEESYQKLIIDQNTSQ